MSGKAVKSIRIRGDVFDDVELPRSFDKPLLPGGHKDERLLALARLLGRQAAREHLQAANDNDPPRDTLSETGD